MAKRKQPKINTGEAIKILANESKIAKEQIIITQQTCRDYFSLFELYITWKGDSEKFLEHVKETIEEKQKDTDNEQENNEQPDEKDSTVDIKNEEVGTE